MMANQDTKYDILYRFHGWLIFARVVALFMFVWPYVRSHIGNRYMCMLRSWPIKIPNMNKMRQKQTNMKRATTIFYRFHRWLIFVRVVALFMFVCFCRILFIFGIKNPTKDKWLVTYTRFRDGRTDKGIPVYPPLCEWGYNKIMFVWPYVCPHILCTKLVICLLSHFIHIWYLGWPWSEHAHIMPITRMADFCESYSPHE
jgi:hypothetical protein